MSLLNIPKQFSLLQQQPTKWITGRSWQSHWQAQCNMGSYGIDESNYETKNSLWKQFPFFIPHILYTQPEKGNSYSIIIFLLLFSDVSSTYKCYKKNPVSIQSNRWRNWNVRLFFILSPHPPPTPTEKKAQVFKTIYRHMYKRMGFFFLFFLFVTTWREKIDKMSADAFSHSKRTADLLVALNVIINETN